MPSPGERDRRNLRAAAYQHNRLLAGLWEDEAGCTPSANANEAAAIQHVGSIRTAQTSDDNTDVNMPMWTSTSRHLRSATTTTADRHSARSQCFQPQSQHAAESGASKWLEFWSRLLLVMSSHLASEAGKPDTLTGASAEARSRESDATKSEDGTAKGAPCESDARECVRILKDDVLRALDRLDDLERLLTA